MTDTKVTKINLDVSHILAESVANRVIELGIPGVQFIEKEHLVELRTFIEGKEATRRFIRDLSQFLDSLREIFPDEQIGPLSVHNLESRDWACAWKKYFKTVEITKNIVIKPSWEDYNPLENQIVIEIDPEMAFGTGTHETTRLCLQKLDSISNSKAGLKGKRILDVGTGTGILSIAAVKLGAAKAVGIDTDPIALTTAINNAKRNKTDKLCSFYNRPLSELDAFDIILANIDSDTLCDLSKDLAERQNSGGLLILTGIANERAQEVSEAFRNVGYRKFKTESMNEWTLIEGNKG